MQLHSEAKLVLSKWDRHMLTQLRDRRIWEGRMKGNKLRHYSGKFLKNKDGHHDKFRKMLEKRTAPRANTFISPLSSHASLTKQSQEVDWKVKISPSYTSAEGTGNPKFRGSLRALTGPGGRRRQRLGHRRARGRNAGRWRDCWAAGRWTGPGAAPSAPVPRGAASGAKAALKRTSSWGAKANFANIVSTAGLT